jgi:hypothetical protein
MKSTKKEKTATVAKKRWIKPEIQKLNLSLTSASTGGAYDGYFPTESN